VTTRTFRACSSRGSASETARAAGAGIKLFSKIGDRVEKGQPLYRIHACDQSELDLAATAAKANCGYTIGARHPVTGETAP
jgi:thymidine phosphorylase